MPITQELLEVANRQAQSWHHCRELCAQKQILAEVRRLEEKDALALVKLDEDLLEDAKNKQIQRFRQKIVELQKQFDEL